jgi:DNA-binding IclR family transcriptional regulator
MRELASQTTETVLLTRLYGNQVICIERVDCSDQPMRIVYERGQVLPVTTHMGASARILMAYLLPEAQRIVLQGIPGVPVAAALRELASIRAAGYVVSGPDAETQVRGIAAPVVCADGSVTAGLGLVGPGFRIPDDLVSTYVALVVKAASDVSTELQAIEA